MGTYKNVNNLFEVFFFYWGSFRKFSKMFFSWFKLIWSFTLPTSMYVVFKGTVSRQFWEKSSYWAPNEHAKMVLQTFCFPKDICKTQCLCTTTQTGCCRSRWLFRHEVRRIAVDYAETGKLYYYWKKDESKKIEFEYCRWLYTDTCRQSYWLQYTMSVQFLTTRTRCCRCHWLLWHDKIVKASLWL